MPISVVCPECGRHLKAPDALQGKRARCPRCRNIVDVPALDAATPLNAADVVVQSPVAATAVTTEPVVPAAPVAEVMATAAAPVIEPRAPVVEPTYPVIEPIVAPVAAEAPPVVPTAPIAETAPTSEPNPASSHRSHHERSRRIPISPWEEQNLPPISPQFDLPRRADQKDDAASHSAPEHPAPVQPAAVAADGATAKPKAKAPSDFLHSGDWPKLASPPPPNTGFLVSGHHGHAEQAQPAQPPSTAHPDATPDGQQDVHIAAETSPEDDDEQDGAALPMTSNPRWGSKIAALFSLAVLAAAGWFLLQQY